MGLKQDIRTSSSVHGQQVSEHIARLPLHVRPALTHLRGLMLSIDTEIKEHIKWNAPAFYYSGKMKAFDAKEHKRDILVMNWRKDKIMCVLPTGACIENSTEILEGDYKDGRRIIFFTDLNDILSKERFLRNAIREWLDRIEK